MSSYTNYLGARRCCENKLVGPQGPKGDQGNGGPIGPNHFDGAITLLAFDNQVVHQINEEFDIITLLKCCNNTNVFISDSFSIIKCSLLKIIQISSLISFQ